LTDFLARLERLALSARQSPPGILGFVAFCDLSLENFVDKLLP
jgi:hypothetical protein